MSEDMRGVTLHFSRVNWLSVSTHGAQRHDGAGSDRYVRLGPVVVGIPHGWKPVQALKELAAERGKLIAQFTARPKRSGSVCTATTACPMRRKVALRPAVHDETACGVSDSELADFMLFDVLSATGLKVISFRFCPWCGERWHFLGATHEKAEECEL